MWLCTQSKPQGFDRTIPVAGIILPSGYHVDEVHAEGRVFPQKMDMAMQDDLVGF